MKKQAVIDELNRLETKRRSLLITSILQPIFMGIILFYFIGLDTAQDIPLIIGIAVFLVALNLLQLLYYHLKYTKLKKSNTEHIAGIKRS